MNNFSLRFLLGMTTGAALIVAGGRLVISGSQQLNGLRDLHSTTVVALLVFSEAIAGSLLFVAYLLPRPRWFSYTVGAIFLGATATLLGAIFYGWSFGLLSSVPVASYLPGMLCL